MSDLQDRSKQDAPEQLLAWMTRFTTAGGLLLSISQDGYNANPPTSWNKASWTGALTPEAAVDRVRAGHNVGTGMVGSLFLLDADRASAIERVDAALDGVVTLSAWSPRGKQWILRGEDVPQTVCEPLGIDTRGSGKGYGMAPGSYRIGQSYRDKWHWPTLSDDQKRVLRALLPEHPSPWFYQVADLADVAPAPRGIYHLLQEAAEANAKAKKRRTEERNLAKRRAWSLVDLEAMLQVLSPDGSREEWLPLLFGAKAQFGDEARAAVEAWSAQSAKYDAANFDATWNAASGNAVSFGTVVYEAKAAGYEVPGSKPGRKAKPKTKIEVDDDVPKFYVGGGARDGVNGWAPRGAQLIADRGGKDALAAVYTSPTEVDKLLRVAKANTPDGSLLYDEDGVARDKDGIEIGTWRISEVDPRGMAQDLGEQAVFWRFDKDGNEVEVDPKAAHVLEMLTAGRKRGLFRRLEGIADGPTLRKDGTLIDQPGYDAATGLVAMFDPDSWPALPANPTREDARKAGELLLDVLADTPFEDDAGRGVYLSLTLSALARDYAAGNIPLHLVTANDKGCGKTTLAKVASWIGVGMAPAIMQSNDVGGGHRHAADSAIEDKKRMMALARAGARVATIDNAKTVGSDGLAMLLTVGEDESIGEFTDRELGRNNADAWITARWRCVLSANGNNLTVAGDVPDRSLYAALHTKKRRMRTDAEWTTHPALETYVRANRKDLYVAGLTMLMAHKAAMGRGETAPLRRFHSFGGWSDRIRSAIVWSLGEQYDPMLTYERLAEQGTPEADNEQAFLGAWHDRFGDEDTTTADVAEACDPGPNHAPNPQYSDALAKAAGDLPLGAPRGKQSINTKSLGRWLMGLRKKPGDYVVEGGHRAGGLRQWRVEHHPPETDEAAPVGAAAQDDGPVSWQEHEATGKPWKPGGRELAMYLRGISSEKRDQFENAMDETGGDWTAARVAVSEEA